MHRFADQCFTVPTAIIRAQVCFVFPKIIWHWFEWRTNFPLAERLTRAHIYENCWSSTIRNSRTVERWTSRGLSVLRSPPTHTHTHTSPHTHIHTIRLPNTKLLRILQSSIISRAIQTGRRTYTKMVYESDFYTTRRPYSSRPVVSSYSVTVSGQFSSLPLRYIESFHPSIINHRKPPLPANHISNYQTLPQTSQSLEI